MGGHYKHPNQRQAKRQEAYIDFLAAHQDADQTPLLYIHRPILDKDFHRKPKSGVFTPVRTPFCIGKAVLHTKP